MYLISLFFLISLISGEKLKQWIAKKQPQFEKTLSLGRSHTSMLDAATGALVIVLPTDKAWATNKPLYEKLKKSGEVVEELMVSIAIMLPNKKVPKTVDEVLKIQKAEGGYLDTVGGNAVKVSKKKVSGKDEVKLTWLVVSSDGSSTRPEGKPVKVDPKPIILDDAVVYKANTISLPPSSGF